MKDENKILLVLVGPPASGKTYFAKEFVKDKSTWIRINRDDIRLMCGDYWVPSREKLISIYEKLMIEEALTNGYNVVIDATNLNPKTKAKWEEKVMEFTPKNRATVQNMPKLPYAVEEALNRLRVNVSFLGSKVKKIMVISSAPDEGKSFIAMQLWRQMAEAGSKSILVDMDLRKSVMVDKYQIVREDNGKILGTSDYLASDDTLDKYVLRTNIGAGDLLPNKENIINPSMLLEGQKLASTFEELDENYRYTFIDAPPLNLVSDGEKIGSLCDGALLVVRAGETPKAMVRNSIRQLERAGCPVVGIALSRAKGAANGYYHKYGNYYGKSYYGKGYGYYGKHGYYGYGTEQK